MMHVIFSQIERLAFMYNRVEEVNFGSNFHDIIYCRQIIKSYFVRPSHLLISLIYFCLGQAKFSNVAFIKKISPFYSLSLSWVNKHSMNNQLLTLQVWISCLGFWRVKCHCNPLKKLPTWAESASRNTTQLSIGSPPVKNPPSTTTVHRMLDFSTRSLSTVMV